MKGSRKCDFIPFTVDFLICALQSVKCVMPAPQKEDERVSQAQWLKF